MVVDVFEAMKCWKQYTICNGKWISARTYVYNIGYHFVWSTKYRWPILRDEVEHYLKKMIMQIAEENDETAGSVSQAIIRRYIKEQKSASDV